MDLLSKLPEWVEIIAVSPGLKNTRIDQIKIQYDFLPKYYRTCKLQRHDEGECKIMHPELK
ncbi:hypothetical protein KY289_008206 [Solanum tuberosum]|nr:hypothetical protein KY289_008206 [Solanum tuberosum]